MEFARHPSKRRYITTAQHTEEGLTLPARCPVCAKPLHIRQSTLKRLPHFAHFPKSSCPTQKKAGEPFTELTPRDPDSAAESAIKRAFRRSWRCHYQRLNSGAFIPYFSVREFLLALDLATKRRSWSYRGLQLQDIPYVLALRCDFTPWTGAQKQLLDGTWQPRRKFWFRFWLESTGESVDQLWINGRGAVSLIRATYKPPAQQGSAPPSINDIVGMPKDIDVTEPFLDGPQPVGLSKHAEDKIEEWFNRHPTFL